MSTTPTGWKCPGCGRCWAPYTQECSHCRIMADQRDVYTSDSSCPNPIPWIDNLPEWKPDMAGTFKPRKPA